MTAYLTSQITSIMLESALNSSTDMYNKTMQQISSGNRVTNISDDPISVTTSRLLDVRISGSTQVSSNINLGKNLLSVAEGTQEGVISGLQRIKDLCVEAANGTYSASDKDAILNEIKLRLNGFDSTADSTNFNQIKLFDGSVSKLNIQTGLSTGNSIDVGNAFTNLHCSQLGGDIRLDDSITGKTWTTEDVQSYMKKIDSAITSLTNKVAVCGSFTNRLDSTGHIVNTMTNNLTNNKSVIMDADIASASSDLVRYQILQNANANILVQANQMPQLALQLLQ